MHERNIKKNPSHKFSFISFCPLSLEPICNLQSPPHNKKINRMPSNGWFHRFVQWFSIWIWYAWQIGLNSGKRFLATKNVFFEEERRWKRRRRKEPWMSGIWMSTLNFGRSTRNGCLFSGQKPCVPNYKFKSINH